MRMHELPPLAMNLRTIMPCWPSPNNLCLHRADNGIGLTHDKSSEDSTLKLSDFKLLSQRHVADKQQGFAHSLGIFSRRKCSHLCWRLVAVVMGLTSLCSPCVHAAHAATSGSGNTYCEAVRNAPECAQTAATTQHTHVNRIGIPNHQAHSAW